MSQVCAVTLFIVCSSIYVSSLLQPMLDRGDRANTNDPDTFGKWHKLDLQDPVIDAINDVAEETINRQIRFNYKLVFTDTKEAWRKVLGGGTWYKTRVSVLTDSHYRSGSSKGPNGLNYDYVWHTCNITAYQITGTLNQLPIQLHNWQCEPDNN